MKVLVVEDSPRMASVLKKGLSEELYVVDVAGDGTTGLHMARTGEYDLVLVDINLPEMDGFELTRRLRLDRQDVPVIMVTARDSVEDRVKGLDTGADDYLVKPFPFEELLARVRAVMRRPGTREKPVLQYGDIVLDPARGMAKRGDRLLNLSAREYRLLQVLMSNPGRIMTRSRLYESVWETEFDGSSNVLDVYVNYLRNKLEMDGEPRVIHTVRGRGYLFGDN
jgi:DNA-binding response OmpR family regulator